MMDRYEREELAELHLRVIHTTVEATVALYRSPIEMGEWTRTAQAETEARREFWEALYRLEMADGPKNPVDVSTLRRRLPRQK